jgi:DNA-binding MarR family transcriptional regulator
VDRKHEFFAHAVNANLTGEQARVLFRLLACEYDGVMGIRQNTMTESNVSRSIKALIDAGLIKRVEDGRQGIPVFQIEKAFCYGPVDKKYRA